MKTVGEVWDGCLILGLAFLKRPSIIEADNEIKCLQGGVKVPTGGIVRERFGFRQRQLTRRNSGTDSESLDGRRRADALHGECIA